MARETVRFVGGNLDGQTKEVETISNEHSIWEARAIRHFQVSLKVKSGGYVIGKEIRKSTRKERCQCLSLLNVNLKQNLQPRIMCSIKKGRRVISGRDRSVSEITASKMHSGTIATRQKHKQFPFFYLSTLDSSPITFQHQGIIYHGHFSKVAGAGESTVFHLMDNSNYYLVRLRFSAFLKEWCFDESSPQDKLSQLAGFFGDYLIAWYE